MGSSLYSVTVIQTRLNPPFVQRAASIMIDASEMNLLSPLFLLQASLLPVWYQHILISHQRNLARLQAPFVPNLFPLGDRADEICHKAEHALSMSLSISQRGSTESRLRLETDSLEFVNLINTR